MNIAIASGVFVAVVLSAFLGVLVNRYSFNIGRMNLTFLGALTMTVAFALCITIAIMSGVVALSLVFGIFAGLLFGAVLWSANA